MKINIFKKLQVVFLVVSASLMVGCSSIDAHAGGGYGKPFSGTALPVARQPCYLRADITSIALYPLSLIDIPLSLATDVVFLPVDLIMVATPTTSYGGVVSLGCPSGSMI
ncbi:YceK/YidQ family lipoprotein [Vibrio parahaemolyticus]|uniref:YceK/YidQ family lipoprotein n=1 Tax=Vibrio parahaemolyticus TaxID=670 RepID=UPI0006A634EB|nr:YceK/YidQ family lipoprotein [Vibrio parahaemolyticus]EGQ8294132.1 YceK/YidQ family lipoprotein [Vibrio parahaemolyticus]EGQ8526586.1 YceK/YidQ family lipoprotein [Vibrio parahaemolyticus]EGQ8539968.1 YceK/YidQ family lipoprotein [Vibrio parahaemolyticus]EGQ9210796.1 YceK/YidQ family lipoprotein [Vibrio parahaemolyticus]EGQ9788638.1 YceK/YidQ family lipoprotein [Vibrio parahaemolyticus]